MPDLFLEFWHAIMPDFQWQSKNFGEICVKSSTLNMSIASWIIRKGPTNKIFLQSSASVSELIGGAGTALYTKTEKSKHRGFVKNALFQ
jgi:hypothetical protein